MPSAPLASIILPASLPPERVRRSKDGRLLAVHDSGFAWLPDRSVDLILTDPPYGIAQETNFHTYEGNTIHSYKFDGEKGWDTYAPTEFVTLLRFWSLEFCRVLRPGGAFIVFTSDQYLSHLWDPPLGRIDRSKARTETDLHMEEAECGPHKPTVPADVGLRILGGGLQARI